MNRYSYFATALVLSLLFAVNPPGRAVYAAASPGTINFQGYLVDEQDNPLTGNYQVTFRIYDDSIGQTFLWEEARSIEVNKGVYSITLVVDPDPFGREKKPIDLSIEGNLYLGMQFAGHEEMRPRYSLNDTSMPKPHPDLHTSQSLSMPPVGPNDPAREPDHVDVRSQHNTGNTPPIYGDITAVTAGPGLAGGGLQGDVELRVAPSGITGGMIADSTIQFSNINQNGAQSGQVMKWNGASWSAGNDSVGAGDNDWVVSGNDMYSGVSGNVGIGTTNPSVRLHVSDAQYSSGNPTNLMTIEQLGYGAPVLRISNPNTANSQIPRMLKIQVSGNYEPTKGTIGMESNHDLGFITDSFERLTISSSGNVGIGTTNPAFKLDVANIGGYASRVNSNFAGNSDIYQSEFRVIDSGIDNYVQINRKWGEGGPLSMSLIDAGSNNESRFFVRADGNVGIGTTNPIYKLQIEGSSYSHDHYTGGVGVGNGSSYAYIKGDEYRFQTSYGYGTGPVKIAVRGNFANDDLDNQDALFLSFQRQDPADYDYGYPYFFDIGQFGATKFRLDKFGNVGIGTTNPQYKLDVAGDIRSTGTIYGNFSGTIDNALHWNGHNWGDTYPYSSNSDLVDGLHGTQFLRNDQSGTLSGSLTVNGPGGSVNAIAANTNGSYSAVGGLNSGSGPGVYAESHSNRGEVGAVTGKARADGGSGVYGETWSLGRLSPPDTGSSVAVYGWAPASGASIGGAALGVLGRCNSYQGSNASVPCGVFGWATATSGVNAGVWGETKSPNGFGVYSGGNMAVDGNFNCNGTKNAVVPTSSGMRALYCQESPEVWFEDFGEGRLTNGRAHIELDALFLETVTINAQHPMKVFVQLNGDCNGVYVERGTTGFEVKELSGGSSNAEFTYRVVAKRKGYEDLRLEETEVISSEFTPPQSAGSR